MRPPINTIVAQRQLVAVAFALLMLPLSAKAQEIAPATTSRADSLREVTRLDVAGNTARARELLDALVRSAADPLARAAAQRATAMSFAFDGDCANAARLEEQVMAYWAAREQAEPQNAFYQEGEMANEAARICIDAGDLDTAERLYRRGTALGLQEPAPKTHAASLWNFRLEHALGRIAARRGNVADAQRHVAAARRILDADPAMAAAQERFFPYLVGYVALYTNDLATAESQFVKMLELPANQADPFMNTLLGITYEKMGRTDQATVQYRKAYDLATAHNPPSAFARPYTRRKLAAP